VITPKDKQKESEMPKEKENTIEEEIEITKKEEIGDFEKRNENRNRQLTEIAMQRDTNLTVDNNLTIMELANELHFDSNKEDRSEEPKMTNPLFDNEENMKDDFKEEEEKEKEEEQVNVNAGAEEVSNLVQDEEESGQMFKKRNDDIQHFEEVADEKLVKENNQESKEEDIRNSHKPEEPTKDLQETKTTDKSKRY
jgi:hypothetical protein